jgi:transmembrane sensor
MSGLPIPVKKVLREPFDDVAIARMGAGARRPRSSRAPWVLAAAAALTAVALLSWLGRAPEAERGPLRTDMGATLEGTIAASSATTLRLDDGSILALTTPSQLDVLSNGPDDVVLLLSDGTVTFDVEPGGPRQWTIECGLLSVEVVGTRFTIERSPDRVAVSVERGRVLVRGERVPERVVALGMGERFELLVEPEAAVPTDPVSMPAVSSSAIAPTAEPLHAGPVEREDPPTTPAWRALADEQRWSEAYGALPASVGTLSERAHVDELLALADVARLSGHPEEAVVPLTRLMEEHPTDPNASLAAFSLGRVEEALGHEQRAADAYERALGLGLPDALVPDALGRRAEALEDAGEHEHAREAARRYLDRAPDGARAEAMRALEARP